MKKLTKKEKKELLQVAARYKELQVQKAQIEEEQNQLKEILKQEMKTRNLESLLLESYKISYSAFTAFYFQTKLFKEEHSKLYDKYCFPQRQERLTVNLGK